MSSSLIPPLLLSAHSRLQAKLQYPACFAPAALQRHPGNYFSGEDHSARLKEKVASPVNHPTTHPPVPAVPRSGRLGGDTKMAWKAKNHRWLSQYTGHTPSRNDLASKLVRVGRGKGSPVQATVFAKAALLNEGKQTEATNEFASSSFSCHGEIPPNFVNRLTIRLNFYITNVCLTACTYCYFQGK